MPPDLEPPNTPPEGQPLLSIRGLCKSYAAPVLDGLDLDLAPGEVHALMGANGAGKSTLARIVSGLTLADGGDMTLDGRPFRPTSKRQAETAGVQIVMQELSLIRTLSLAENLFLTGLPTRWGWIRRGEIRRRATEALAAVGLEDLDPGMELDRLGVGNQQLVEIAAVLARPCCVLILDEPTAALTDPQIERLFGQIGHHKARGGVVLYVSHRLDELRRIADRISILRDGRLIATRPADTLDMAEAVRLMTGTEVARVEREAASPRSIGAVALRVEGLCRGELVREVSFEVREGEVFGIAGLVGSGRTELLRAICGADRAERGTVKVGDAAARRFADPRQAARAGIAFIPEDRQRQGLLLPLPIVRNATLATLPRFAGRLGLMRARQEAASTSKVVEPLQLRCRSLDQPVQQLSGGNQQKVLLARLLLADPKVALLDEPTRGVDVAAKAAIARTIDDLARRGKAVVVVSSELHELMAMSDRIGVMSAGRLVEILERGRWSREAIIEASFRGYTNLAGREGRAGQAS